MQLILERAKVKGFQTFTQWEIGWLKLREVFLPNFVFEPFIRLTIFLLRKNHNVKPLVTCQISGTGRQSQNFGEMVIFFWL